MSYPLMDDDERDDESTQPEAKKDIKQEYEEYTAVDDDEKEFMTCMLKLSKIEREAALLSGEFHDQEIAPYEAKVRLLALLDITVKLRDELYHTM